MDIDKDLKRKKKVLPQKATKERSPEGEERPTEEPVVEEKRPVRKSSPRKREEEPSEFLEKVLAIKRVTKVTKGGKKLAFSALVVVGNEQGRVGYSLGKAGEVAAAIKKALSSAKRSMISIPLKGTTIPHEIIGSCGAAQVLLKPAAEGTGVIASGAVRAVCDGAGIRNILTKCHRSNNPTNVVKATFDGLTRLKIAASQPFDSAQGKPVDAGASNPADVSQG